MGVTVIVGMVVGVGLALRELLLLLRDWSSRRRDIADEVASRVKVRAMIVERTANGEIPISGAVVEELLGLGGDRDTGGEEPDRGNLTGTKVPP